MPRSVVQHCTSTLLTCHAPGPLLLLCLQTKYERLLNLSIMSDVAGALNWLAVKRFALCDVRLTEMLLSHVPDPGAAFVPPSVKITNAQGLRQMNEDGLASSSKKGVYGQ